MTVPATSTPSSVLRYLPLTGLAGAPRAAGNVSASNGAPAPTLRTATLDGVPYLVCPVVAVVGDIVWRPMGSEGPEYVPSTVLADFPSQWNGRPVVLNHPGNGLATANDPTVLEAASFGVIFAARFERGALQMDAWISRARAEKVGPKAVTLFNLIEAGETVSVSIGAYAAVMRKDGVSPSGVRYEWEWVALIASDHLAMLEDGVAGACSTEVGCGTPRAAAALVATTPEIRVSLRAAAEILGVPNPDPTPSEILNIEGATMPEPTTVPPRRAGGLLNRLLGAITGSPRTAEPDPSGPSDADTRGALWDVLRATEPGFDWIQEVFPGTTTVVYTVSPTDSVVWYSRTYTMQPDGTATLNDDRVEVEPVMRYEPVAASTTDSAESTPATTISTENHETPSAVVASTPCGCHNHDDAKGESTMPDNPTTTVAAASTTESAPATAAAQTAAQPVAAQPAASVPSDAVTISAARLAEMETELAQLKPIAAAYHAQDAARRTVLITSLVTAQQAYTQADLEAKPTDELEKLATALRVQTAAGETTTAPVVPLSGISYEGARLSTVTAGMKEPPCPYGLDKKTTTN